MNSYKLLNIDDFNIICLICLMSKENMTCLTQEDYHKLKKCISGFEFYHIDKFPQQICAECLTQLHISYDFKLKYTLAVKILYDVYSKANEIELDSQINFNDNFKQEGDFEHIEIKSDKGVDCECNFVNAVEDDNISNKNEYNVEFLDSESLKEFKTESDETGNIKNSHELTQETIVVARINNIDDGYNKIKLPKTNEREDNNNKNELNQETIEYAKSLIELLTNSPYKLANIICIVCNRQFSTRSRLLKHIKTHVKDIRYSYICTLCDEGFYSIKDLNGHITRHSRGPSYNCDLCSKVFMQLHAFSKHYSTTHNVKSVDCTKCSKTFPHPLLVEHNEKEAHNEEEHVGGVCGDKFLTQLSYKQHLAKHSKVRRYSCMNCNKTYTRLETLRKHVRITHKNDQLHLECTKIYASGKKCSQKFIHPVELKRHEQSHHKYKDYTCDVCGEKFRNNYGLKRHKINHSDSRPFTCIYCDKNYKRQNELNQHVRFKHRSKIIENALNSKTLFRKSPKNSEICFICGKHTQHLNIHLRSHPEKESECSVCLKSYKSKYSLQEHMRLLHPSDGIGKRVYCSICNKALAEQSNLVKHMTCVHSSVKRHKCSFCDNKYKLKSHLTEHIRNVHNNERPHKCTVCGMEFFRKSGINNHMRTHVDKRL